MRTVAIALVLLLAAGRGLAAPAAEPDEQTLRSLADRIALSCECVVLLPRLSGGTARWQHGRLLSEADAAPACARVCFAFLEEEQLAEAGRRLGRAIAAGRSGSSGD